MENRLIYLARSKFGELTRSEEVLLGASVVGDFTYGGPNKDSDDPSNDPARGDKSAKDREIRAELTTRLCIERAVAERVHFRGIQAPGGRNDGLFDFNFVNASFQ